MNEDYSDVSTVSDDDGSYDSDDYSDMSYDDMEGGNDEGSNVLIADETEISSFEKYYPKKTRDHISIYEYSRVLTSLAKYLFDLNDLKKYLKNDTYDIIINPGELAYKLLEEKKFDAIIDRGIEKVSYSTLKINPHWKTLIENNFARHNKSLKVDFLDKLGLSKN